MFDSSDVVLDEESRNWILHAARQTTEEEPCLMVFIPHRHRYVKPLYLLLKELPLSRLIWNTSLLPSDIHRYETIESHVIMNSFACPDGTY